MVDQIVLDLGEEYGEIAVTATSTAEDEGLLEAGLVDDSVEAIKVKLQDVLAAPLTGIGLALRAALPQAEALDNESYRLDGFSAEFQLGLDTKMGAVFAEIVNSGSFSCTYSWKRK